MSDLLKKQLNRNSRDRVSSIETYLFNCESISVSTLSGLKRVTSEIKLMKNEIDEWLDLLKRYNHERLSICFRLILVFQKLLNLNELFDHENVGFI